MLIKRYKEQTIQLYIKRIVMKHFIISTQLYRSRRC